MKKRKKGYLLKTAMFMAFVCLTCGCTESQISQSNEDISKVYEIASSDSYDSMDTAVIKSVDQENKTITFLNLKVRKSYTLSYDGTSCFYDKNGQSLSVKQLVLGDTVDLTFYKIKKRLNTLQVSGDVFVMENVKGYALSKSGKIMEIYGEKYKVRDDTLIFSEGEKKELMDLNTQDTLKIVGKDHEIYSITITQGHGYIRLSNDTSVIGGWIEVGKSIIKPIVEDMLLIVPEGDYQVIVSKGSSSMTKNVTIKKDQETTIDVSELEPEEVQMGSVFFTLSPEETQVYIDGSKIDASAPVTLTYGIHQLIARATGYETLSKYFKVASENATLEVVLESTTEEEDTVSGNNQSDLTETTNSSNNEKITEIIQETTSNVSQTTSSSNNQTEEADSSASDTTASTSYRVYIDSPDGVEVYLDGTYIGLSPLNFKKSAGSHTITLRKSGYTTRSYTVVIDEELKDISYSFSELQKVSE